MFVAVCCILITGEPHFPLLLKWITTTIVSWTIITLTTINAHNAHNAHDAHDAHNVHNAHKCPSLYPQFRRTSTLGLVLVLLQARPTTSLPRLTPRLPLPPLCPLIRPYLHQVPSKTLPSLARVTQRSSPTSQEHGWIPRPALQLL